MKERRANAVAVMALAWGVAWAAMGAVLGIRAIIGDVAPLPALIATALKYGTYGLVVGLWFGLIVVALSGLWTRKYLFIPICAALAAAVAYAVGIGDGQSRSAGIALALLGAACAVISLRLAARQPNQGVAAGAESTDLIVTSQPALDSAASLMLAHMRPRRRTPIR